MGGGSVATRGLLVQTLLALLDVVQADQPFTEITLEPAIGDEQFDFVWRDHADTYAIQVKSTTNMFEKPDVEKWAKKLEAARSTEHCRLMLVGLFHPSMERVTRVGNVAIERRNLDLPALIREAAHLLAGFLEAEEVNPGTASERERVVKALVTELELYATESRTLARDAFTGLLRQWIDSAPRKELKFDISRIFEYAPAELIGRETETKLLNDAWAKVRERAKKHPHVLTFVAPPGEGKTALVAKWAVGLAYRDWPGCDAAFAWSFYRSGTDKKTGGWSNLFFKEALTWFGDRATAESAKHASEKGKRLAQLVGEQRALLILDGVEPLQYPPGSPMDGKLKDDGVAALLKGLATANRGLCVVTTRYSLLDLKAFWHTTAPEKELKRLSKEAGVRLLLELGVREESGAKAEFEKLVENVKGHSLTLILLGKFLKRAFHGDIRQRDRVKFEKADEKVAGGHAFRTMAAYEQWLLSSADEGQREVAVLRLMGLFDRPAEAGCISALRKEPAIEGLTEPLIGLEDDDWNYTLSNLAECRLITRQAGDQSVDAHPLVREYSAGQLRKRSPDAWQAAHSRLYEYFRDLPERKCPETLEGMEPLLRACAHGCQAGRHRNVLQEVYWPRVQRKEIYYLAQKLGASEADMGVLSWLFEKQWIEPVSTLGDKWKTLILSCAGLRLRATGRLEQAREALETALRILKNARDWEHAASTAGHLCSTVLLLGNVQEGVRYASESVKFADRNKKKKQRSRRRNTLGYALHQAGDARKALKWFRSAERVLGKRLHFIFSYRFCDLLLDQGCVAEVRERATDSLRYSRLKSFILDVALAELCLGCVALTAWQRGDRASCDVAEARFDKAVQGLRESGRSDHLPLGLLARASLRFAKGDTDGCRADLGEAWQIAERGSMRLFMADVLLHRGRLFRDKGALAEARKLIEECGYHRRDGELADAEEAAKGW